ENLRKQAKLYVRWHRDGYYPVAAHIRHILPRFKDLSDREILEREFKLSDAQELIARQSGFESWQALVSGVQAMPDTATRDAATPTLTEIEAQLFVADIKASCAFFTESSASRWTSPMASRLSTPRSGATRCGSTCA